MVKIDPGTTSVIPLEGSPLSSIGRKIYGEDLFPRRSPRFGEAYTSLPPKRTIYSFKPPRNGSDNLPELRLGETSSKAIFTGNTSIGTTSLLDLTTLFGEQVGLEVTPNKSNEPPKYPIEDLFNNGNPTEYLTTRRETVVKRAMLNADFWKTFLGLDENLSKLEYSKDEIGEFYLALIKAWNEDKRAAFAYEQYSWLHNKFKEIGFFKGIVTLYHEAHEEKYKNSFATKADYLLALNRLGREDIALASYEEIARDARRRVEAGEPGAREMFHEILLAPGTSYKNIGFEIDELIVELSTRKDRATVDDLSYRVDRLKRLLPNDGILAGIKTENNVELLKLRDNEQVIEHLRGLSKETHEKSISYYKGAFEHNYSDYAGICYLRSLPTTGKIKEATLLSPLVYQSTYKADYQKSFWPMAIRLETSIINADEATVKKLLPKVIQLGQEQESELDSLIYHLQACYKSLDGRRRIVLDSVISQLENRQSTEATAINDPITDAIERKWLRFDHVSGGQVVKNRGIVPNINNNYLDRYLTLQILQHKPHNEKAIVEMNFEEARERIAKLVTMWFRLETEGVRKKELNEENEETRWLELLNTPTHERIVDKPCNKYFDFFGSRETGLNSTNIMLLPYLGLGDCRNSHFVYQRLLGGYISLRKHLLLKEAYEAKEQLDVNKYTKAMEEIKELNKIEVFVGRIVVNGNMKVNKLYDIPKTRDNKFIYSETPNDPEEHTTCFIMYRDDKGNITHGKTDDIWYNVEYPLRDFEIRRENIIYDNGTDTLTFKLPNAVEAYDESSKTQKRIDINLRFAPYAGPSQKITRTTGPSVLRVAGQLVSPPGDISLLFDEQRLRSFQDSFREALLAA